MPRHGRVLYRSKSSCARHRGPTFTDQRRVLHQACHHRCRWKSHPINPQRRSVPISCWPSTTSFTRNRYYCITIELKNSIWSVIPLENSWLYYEFLTIGFGVTFTPYLPGEDTIREGRDLKVVFQAFSICITSTAWRVGETDPTTGRRFVETGDNDTATGYFRIDRDNFGIYNIGWCPSDVPIRGRPRCGRAGILIEKGLRLLALDGSAFPFEFVRAWDKNMQFVAIAIN